MKRKRPLVNVLIIAEVIVLILLAAVIALGLYTDGDETSDSSYDTDSGQEDNRIESGDSQEDPSSDTADEEAQETSTQSDIYDTIRLTFSDEVEEMLDGMSEEELAALLFVTTPEELTGVSTATAAGDSTQSALTEYPVSGLIYRSRNFQGEDQLTTMLSNTLSYYQEIMGLDLFLIVEELGGEDASPVASALGYDIEDSPAALAAAGSTSAVTAAASARAEYLSALGFTAVLGPVADAADGSSDAFDDLTYGDTPLNAADYIEADIRALQSGGILSIVQAFPGVNTATDDYSAYQAAIDAGASMIQVSSAAASDLTGDESLPAMFSASVTSKLRDEMGFTGLLMTSDLSESGYEIDEAVVLAVRAGINLLYTTDDFEIAYEALLSAISSGEITETMLMNAAGRILTAKLG